MTRNEAIEWVGLAYVETVEAVNCEPTSRAYDHEDGEIEWAGCIKIDYTMLTPEQQSHLPIGGCRLTAIYYTDANDAKIVEDNGGDWSALNWDVHHYTLD